MRVGRIFPTGSECRARKTHAVRDDDRTFCGRPVLGWEAGDPAEVSCGLCLRAIKAHSIPKTGLGVSSDGEDHNG